MSNHEEFPTMTPAAVVAYNAAVNAAQQSDIISSTFDFRRALAAFQREAMKQAHAAKSDSMWQAWGVLEAIAASLHNPPPPPTLAEAREADLHTPEGQATVSAFLANLAMETQP